ARHPAPPGPGRGARDRSGPAVFDLAQLGVQAHPRAGARRTGAPPPRRTRTPSVVRPPPPGRGGRLDRAAARVLDRAARRPPARAEQPPELGIADGVAQAPIARGAVLIHRLLRASGG